MVIYQTFLLTYLGMSWRGPLYRYFHPTTKNTYFPLYSPSCNPTRKGSVDTTLLDILVSTLYGVQKEKEGSKDPPLRDLQNHG